VRGIVTPMEYMNIKSKANKKKDEQLGMPYGTASNILRKSGLI
jgi:hypothetical protein